MSKKIDTTQLQKNNEKVQELQNKFIDLANQLKDDGEDIVLINTAMMLASGHYATYVTVGNEGYLKPGGVQKITQVYQHNLAQLQRAREAHLNPEGKAWAAKAEKS